MTRDESIALYERAQAAENKKKGDGAKVWNAWSQEVLRQKAELQLSGKWDVGSSEAAKREAASRATKSWSDVAAIDFTNYIFQDADFANFLFPANANFDDATFSGDVRFHESTFKGSAKFNRAAFQQNAGFHDVNFQGSAWFIDATFRDYAGFATVTFHGLALFIGATFVKDGKFDNATFEGDAVFRNATFKWYAGFHGAMLKREARFEQATFEKFAGFSGATFEGRAWFDCAAFGGDARFDCTTFQGVAGFDSTEFQGSTKFDDCRFESAVSFRATASKSNFVAAGAQFQKVPDFSQATFSEAPRFDNTHICRAEPQGGWHNILFAYRYGRDDAARYRALKALAIRGHDHQSELNFFAGEIVSRRGIEDFAFPHPRDGKIWPGGVRYWAGQAYETLSDFGRSMLRPLFWWIALMGMYAVGYLSQYFVAGRNSTGVGGLVEAYLWTGIWLLNKLSFGAFPAPAELACNSTNALVEASRMEPLGAAGYVAARRALILNTGDDNDKLSMAYACLYGDYSEQMPNSFRVIPHIPDAVSALAIMQSLLSAALIFLFLLAVRNQFRIK
jgi:uncharacterized protein YjbI with pentapeptide repeats